LVDGGGLIDDPEGTGVGAAAGEEDLDDEAVRLRDKVLGGPNISQPNSHLSFSFHSIRL
jgi:hypothetical protein